MRNLSAGILAEITANNFKTCRLFKAVFEEGDVRLTNHVRPLVWGGLTYSAAGGFLDFSDVEETLAMQAPEASISLSGISPTYRSLILSQEYVGNEVDLYIAFLDDDDEIIDVLKDYSGIMNGSDFVDEASQGTSTITVNTTFELARFEDARGCRTNPAEWRILHPLDSMMDSVPFLIDITKDW